ncbi:MAG TPA: helix-turn-helix domain-containing protein [Syntrophales bacterium]|nr:helix-turn-helix domain-containing protein [Syntrophales bacterium]HOX95018.1 helix-turn-helix domain-containing protein [Syntrophales bacterium]HPI56873.1 helix-turn-helix domain-containing protein [Syntrophales bacterium]HPN23459.1 helix-turn-helix domain-containing protein [Syntrophales bacterium]HQM28016.1 helix-turn-helix domain-containing protein [Syntrophales bacterium]
MRDCKGLPERDLLRPKEVADYFQVPVRRVYQWREEGLLKGINFTGGTLRIFRASVIAFIHNGSSS